MGDGAAAEVDKLRALTAVLGVPLREEGVGHRMISQTRAVLGHAGHSLGTVVAQAETAPA